MTGPQPDPTVIGTVSAPPFARLPDPATLFAGRAARLRARATGSEIAPFLDFIAGLAEAQHAIQDGLPEPEMPDAAARARARDAAMPPLDRAWLVPNKVLDITLERLLGAARAIAQPPDAAAALARVREGDVAARAALLRDVLAAVPTADTLAEHVFAAAAVQVHLVRMASRLDAVRLVPVGDGVCPSCGGPPVASLIVGWMGAHGARFCACALCATLWNHVRVKCVLCGSTEGIAYQEIEGGSGTVKAETCDACRAYVKIFHQHKDPAMDPVADDIASLGLDLMLRDGPYRRGGHNPFLLGY